MWESKKKLPSNLSIINFPFKIICLKNKIPTLAPHILLLFLEKYFSDVNIRESKQQVMLYSLVTRVAYKTWYPFLYSVKYRFIYTITVLAYCQLYVVYYFGRHRRQQHRRRRHLYKYIYNYSIFYLLWLLVATCEERKSSAV